MATVTVTFSFDDKADSQLKRWLDGLPKRGKSKAIRTVLRAYLGYGEVSLGDVYQVVRGLERKLQNGVIVPQRSEDTGTGEVGVDQDVLDNLDKLGLDP